MLNNLDDTQWIKKVSEIDPRETVSKIRDCVISFLEKKKQSGEGLPRLGTEKNV